MFSTRVWRPDLNDELDSARPKISRARKTAPTARRTTGERPSTFDPDPLALTTSSVGPVIGTAVTPGGSGMENVSWEARVCAALVKALATAPALAAETTDPPPADAKP